MLENREFEKARKKTKMNMICIEANG